MDGSLEGAMTRRARSWFAGNVEFGRGHDGIARGDGSRRIVGIDNDRASGGNHEPPIAGGRQSALARWVEQENEGTAHTDGKGSADCRRGYVSRCIHR